MPSFAPSVSALAVASVLLGAPVAQAAGEPAAAAEVQSALDLWKQAIIKKDRAAFDKVLHPDLVYGHSNGVVETKTQAIEHVLRSNATWEAVSFSNTEIRLRRDTAYVTGQVEYRQRGKDDKQTVIKLFVLHVFVKGPGRTGWQMIARQATRPGAV